MILKFAPFTPDRADFGNPGVISARNVIPDIDGYRPFRSLDVATDAVAAARVLGATPAIANDATTFNFAGTATKLYELSNTTWSDVTRASGGDYSVASQALWDFTQFGDFLIAVNGTDAPQKYELSSDTEFAALGGSPPVAQHVATVRDFVVFGNLASNPQRVRWSAIDNAEDYPTIGSTDAAEKQSDQQDLVGNGGWVQAIVGGDYGLILQERSIWRMQYIGGDLIFQFDEVEPGKGTPAPRSVVRYGELVFYLGQDDFYAWDGVQSHSLGREQIAEWFYNDVDEAALWAINATIDPVRKLVYWSYPSTSSSEGIPDSIIVYNWSSRNWAYARLEVEFLAPTVTQGWTMEEIASNYNSNLDAIEISLDSRFWTGGNMQIGGFNYDHKSGTFEGAPLSAEIETTEGQIVKGRRARISGFRPLVDGSNPTIQGRVGRRDRLNDAVSWGDWATQTATGRINLRGNGRYLRARVGITGEWDYAQGIEIEPQDVQDGGLR